LELRSALLPAVVDQRTVSLEVRGANGSSRVVSLDFSTLPELPPAQDPLAATGLQLLMPAPSIAQLEAGGAAQLAGLQKGDVLKAVNQQAIQSAAQFVRLVQAAVDQPLNIGIERAGRALEITVTPQKIRVNNDQWQGRLGVGLHAPIEKILVQINLGEALVYGWNQTINNVVLSFRLLWKMLTAQLSVQHLSGPITVADYAGKTAQIGLTQYLGFIAVISIGIAVFNLLPIPMLDGGHLMYHALEFIRRKPLTMQTMQLLKRGGISLLALVMSVAVFNDLSRLLT
jgi:regulator of sigma E protease